MDITDQLNAEADRFKKLSQENAHHAMFTATPDTRPVYEKLARDHLIRAETYRDSARLAAKSKIVNRKS